MKVAQAVYKQLLEEYTGPIPDYYHKNAGIVASRLAGAPNSLTPAEVLSAPRISSTEMVDLCSKGR